MQEKSPSLTAKAVAMRRAVHQVLDDPIVFADPLALKIVGVNKYSPTFLASKWYSKNAMEERLRAFLVVRSRFAEDELKHAIGNGVSQYVVLGAGLDTFAYRHHYADDALHVFEVDHPATQAWKKKRLEKSGIDIPATLTFSPVDFETETLSQGLERAGFNTAQSAFFAWLGVTPYITIDAVTNTLKFIAALPKGSGIVFDYMISPALLSSFEQRLFDLLAKRVALAGEPFQTFFDPNALNRSLIEFGFTDTSNLSFEDLQSRYVTDFKADKNMPSLGRVMLATIMGD